MFMAPALDDKVIKFTWSFDRWVVGDPASEWAGAQDSLAVIRAVHLGGPAIREFIRQLVCQRIC